jgi:hypothetical protein
LIGFWIVLLSPPLVGIAETISAMLNPTKIAGKNVQYDLNQWTINPFSESAYLNKKMHMYSSMKLLSIPMSSQPVHPH